MVASALRPAILAWGTCALFTNVPALGQAEALSGAEQDRTTGPENTAPNGNDDVPERLSKGDWVGIRAAYEAGRHAAHSVEGGFEARNPGQEWQTRFDGRGFLTEPDSGGWTWGLELERYGFAGREQRVTRPARVSAEGGRVAYEWDATLEEWYVNDMRGLEHGYTVHRRPPRYEQDAESLLTFTLAVRGDLRAEVAADGCGVRFVDEGGSVALTYGGLAVFDADGRRLDAGLEALDDGSNNLLLSVEERGARYPIIIDPTAQQAYLKASNPGASDEFGYSVAVSGNTVVVGAPGENSSATGVNGDQSTNNAQDSGAAYVFVRSGTTWSQEAYLKASNTDANDSFGRSVAVSGDRVVVGAYHEDSGVTGVNGNQGDNSTPWAGAAYVFVRSGTTWSPEAYLKASNTNLNDEFGGTVAVSGDTLVVGARFEDSNATGVGGNQSSNSAANSGAAYVFVRSGASWSQQAYLKASNTDVGDEFGWSVALSDEIVVVGAVSEDSHASGLNGDQTDNGALGAGAAYVFVRSGTNWSQEAYLKASNTDGGDEFGSSVAASGDTVVVGAYLEDSNATGVNGNQADNSELKAGAAYVFVRNGTTWSQEAYLKAFNARAGDLFGNAVAVSGDTMVVGAVNEASDATGVNSNNFNYSLSHAGAAYLFVRNIASWSQTAYLKPSHIDTNDWFGKSVAVSGDWVVVGMPLDDSNASGVNGGAMNDSMVNAGSVTIFVKCPGTSYCVASVNSTGHPAQIVGAGSTSLFTDNFLLIAEPVPRNQNGIFFYGPGQTQVPFGNGFLCVASGATGIARLPVVQSDGFEVMTHQVDFSAPPTQATQITAGSTWYFQAWFRDPLAAPASFNLSDGLRVMFAL